MDGTSSVSVTPERCCRSTTRRRLGLLNTPAGPGQQRLPRRLPAWTPAAPWAGYAWNSKANNTYTATDNLQWEFGKHNFTFGGQ